MYEIMWQCYDCRRRLSADACLQERDIPTLVCPVCGQEYVYTRLRGLARDGWHKLFSAVEIKLVPMVVHRLRIIDAVQSHPHDF